MIKFDYSIEKDAWWWAKLARDKDLFGMDWKKEVTPMPEKLIKEMNRLPLEKAIELAADHLKSRELQSEVEEIINYEKQVLRKAWRKREDQFFKLTEELFEKEMYRKEFYAYFTTLFMCPYDYDKHMFMVSVWKSLPWQIGTIAHEVMHLQFINQYYDYIIEENSLTKDQFEEIKEAVTIILNEEQFERIVLIEQLTYPDHEKTADMIKKLRTEGKSLKEIVDQYINIKKSE
jgi:hypothetical protein